jgi:hypothetical protein
LGQRVWFLDGSVYVNEWDKMPDDGVLIRMIYYLDGTKQIQQGLDYYYEAPHFSGVIRGAGMDKDEIVKRYQSAVIKRGIWAPDEYYSKIVQEAMASTWEHYGN